MQHSFSAPVHSRPVDLSKNTESTVYGLFALAMALTVVGAYFGAQAAPMLVNSGVHIVLLIVQLGLIFTSRWWMNQSPLNYLLFGLFPAISGFTIAPYLLMVMANYANGTMIIVNALSATAFMASAAAVFARTTSWNLGFMGKFLFFGVIGLIIMGLLQWFVPSLRTTGMELAISGAGVVIFALFTAYDVQRVMHMSKAGANPFVMALSLYLDIFNLFLYVLRFMLVLYGDRR